MSAASCGRRGPDVRSDCWFEIEPLASGGIDLKVTSKVDFMYGEANRNLIIEGLKHFGVEHARVTFEDSGAVPFVIMARLETCVRRLLSPAPRPPSPDACLLALEPSPSFARPSSKDRWRRSRLYLPGNEPKFILTARVHQPDAVILDLEDSVRPADKDAALALVCNALRAVDFGECERMVRINQLPAGLDEIEPLVRAGVNVILIPKCETAGQVSEVDALISSALSSIANRQLAGGSSPSLRSPSPRRGEGRGEENQPSVWLMPIIETCEGMFNAAAIAKASPRIVALTYGLEDYLADLGGIKTPAGLESLWARSQVANAAKAAGLQAIDTVYADVADLAGLEASCHSARELGFEGKGCIHPRQVPVVNLAFTPSGSEISRATQIVLAFKDAQAKGKNVVAVGSKMIDPPVVARAQKTIELAIAAGKLTPDWDALSVTPSERGESRGLLGETPPIATPSLRRNDENREAK